MSANQSYVLSPQRTGFSDLKLKSGDIPKPSPTQVLIKVHAVSLNYRDLIIAQNKYPLYLKDGDIIPVSDGAGEIIEVGEKVQSEGKWKKGDRVMGIFTQKHQRGATPDDEEIHTALGGGVDGMLAKYVVVSILKTATLSQLDRRVTNQIRFF